MSQEKSLPPRPHPDWYRKAAKKKLAALRHTDPAAKLADAQRLLAREHGFSSWRKLVAEVEARYAAATSPEFFEALRRDDYAKMQELLRTCPALVAARTPRGETPLHVAAEINNHDTIRILIAHGADPQSTYGESSHTALSWAVTTMAYDAARELLRAGVRPDLFCAAGLGDLEAVRSHFDARGAVKRGASRTCSSRYGPDGQRLPQPSAAQDVVSDALYIACRNGHAQVGRYLLERGADPGFRAFLGGTPLHWAHFGGSAELVELLLAAGADPGARDDEYDCTPRAFGICAPSGWGLARLVYERLSRDPTLASVHDGRGTPLHEAAREGHAMIVRLLLTAGADRTVRDREGLTPLERARAAGHREVCALLEPSGGS